MGTRRIDLLSRARPGHAEIKVVSIGALATLLVLQAYRVFVPYLVFEIDQSERVILGVIALAVFGCSILAAPLFRFAGSQMSGLVAIALLSVARLGIQFVAAPGVRWILGAIAVVAWIWLMAVLIPGRGVQVSFGIGIAFLADLIVRSLRGTLDLPWLPSARQDLATIGLSLAILVLGWLLAARDWEHPAEPSFRSALGYTGLGSGIALWLVASGNTGFAEVTGQIDLPTAFLLLAIGTTVALLLALNQDALDRWIPGQSRLLPIVAAALALVSVVVWAALDAVRLNQLLILVFAFATTTLTMRTVQGAATPARTGRWATSVALTLGFLLQVIFVFTYFAMSGPIWFLLFPVAVVSVAASLGRGVVPRFAPIRATLIRATGIAAVLAFASWVWIETDSSSPISIASEPGPVVVMTYNIQEGFPVDNRWSLEQTARTIEASEPDIVLLQEVTRGWLVMSSVDQVRWLSERLGMDYAYAGNSHDGLWGNVILSRMPILSSASTVFSTTDNLRRGAVAADIETGAGTLRVIDTHLDNPSESIEVRLEQLAELLGLWNGETPAVIGGDFNADPGSPEWQMMIDAGFIDTGAGSGVTTSEDERRIDYLFVTPDLAPQSFSVPDVWTSDHKPVVVELEMPS